MVDTNYSSLLKGFLKVKFGTSIEQIERSWFRLPSGVLIYVNGSKLLETQGDSYGWYDLGVKDYEKLATDPNCYYVIILDRPELTFVLPPDKVREIFGEVSYGNNNEWHYKLRRRNGHYILRPSNDHRDSSNIHYVEGFLNKWDQIEDLKEEKDAQIETEHDDAYSTKDTQYFLIQVNRPGSENLLQNGVYQHENWMDTPRDVAHGKVRIGDILVIYFARNSIGFQKMVKKIYRVDSVSNNNTTFHVSEVKELNGISLQRIKESINNGNIRKEVFNKIAQQGFNIAKIEKSDYDQLLSLDNISLSPKAPLTFRGLQKFLLEEMEMHSNYQPIMIKTLLVSRGKATKDDIALKIKEGNPENEHQDFKNVPVYGVLQENDIVIKNGNEFILNSEELTEEQRQQLIALCNWKIYNMSLQLEELIDAFDKNRNLFDPNGTSLDELEKLRSAFVSDFSSERILKLELDEYVVGKPDPNTDGINKSTFCYRLKHEMDKLSSFGVRSQLDFGIYYNKENQTYDYTSKDKYSSPQEAFSAIKSEIYSILQAGEQYHTSHNLDALMQNLNRDYNIRRNVISKILSVYYPEDFVQMHTLDTIESVLRSFGKSVDEFDSKFFPAQAYLLEIKNSHPVMRDWNNNDYSHFLWNATIERNKSVAEFKEKDKKKTQNKQEPLIFVTAYDDSNLNRSKELGILGWKSHSKLLSSGDYVFVFNKSTLNVDSCFKTISKSDNMYAIWSDELESKQLIYKNRWNAEVVADNLRISLKDINNMPPFNKESFQLRLKGNFPMPLNSPALDNKYRDFCNFLLNKINYGLLGESGKSEELAKSRLKEWHFLTIEDINQIVQSVLQGNRIREERTLAIRQETVKRIITHLISSKHVILIGPPGTGKTDLARRLLRELSERIIGSPSPIEAVASYEWGRYEVIGGNSLKTNPEGNSYIFHLGCITKAIKERKLLLIDEFNRADMNKAFGEMFLAIDHGIIQLREDENPDFDLSLYDKLKNSITIPRKFRMICTMNDYDKSLLNDLSYGLLRRFAFVEIDAPANKDEEMGVVMERMKIRNNHANSDEVITDEVVNIISTHVDKFLDFMLEIRNKRKLGVSTSIDVAKYLAAGYALTDKTDVGEDGNNNGILWKLINEALVDYILPQLDRLDLGTLVYVKDAAYKTLLDDHGNVPEIIRTGFISKLENVISGLDNVNRLFATPKNNEDI